MHGNIFDKILEGLILGNEIGFAVHFHQHANLAAGMNIGTNGAFGRNTTGFFGSSGKALRSQIIDSLLLIATGFG